MNHITTTVIALSLSLTTTLITSKANAADFVATDHSKLTNLCITAAQGDKEKMRIAIRKSGYSKHYVATNIKCNDQMLIEFVAKYGKSPNAMNAMITGKRAPRGIRPEIDLAKL